MAAAIRPGSVFCLDVFRMHLRTQPYLTNYKTYCGTSRGAPADAVSTTTINPIMLFLTSLNRFPLTFRTRSARQLPVLLSSAAISCPIAVSPR